MRLQSSLWVGLEGPLPTVCSWFWWIWEGGWGVQRGLQQLSDLQQEAGARSSRGDDFIKFLVCNLRSLLMKTWWNRRPKEKMKRDERKKNWRTKEMHDAGNGKGIFFIWKDTVSFWGTWPKRRMVHEGSSSHSECSPVLKGHLWREKKELLPRYPLIIFSRG